MRAHVLDRVRVFGELAEVVLDVDGLDLIGHSLGILGEIIDGFLHVSVRDGAGCRLVGVGEGLPCLTAFWGAVVTCWLASEIADAASAMGVASFMQVSDVDSSEESGAAWVGASALARDLRG